MADDNLDKKSGEKVLPVNYDQTVEPIRNIIRSAINEKLQHGGAAGINQPKLYVDSLSSSGGDNGKIDGANTDADFDTDHYQCKRQAFSNPVNNHSFESSIGTDWVITNTASGQKIDRVSGWSSDGSYSIRLWLDGDGSYEEITIEQGGISLDNVKEIIYDRHRDNVDGTSGNCGNNTIGARLIDESDGTVVKSDSASFNYGSGTQTTTGITWDVESLSGNYKIELYFDHTNCGNQDKRGYFDDFNATEDPTYLDSTLQTDVIVSTTDNINSVFIDSDFNIPSNTDVTVDVSVDGGSNFDKTNVPIGEVIDVSDVANPGSQLVLRYNLTTNGEVTPEVQNYGAKAWS